MDRILQLTESELSKLISDAVNKANELTCEKFKKMTLSVGKIMERRNVNILNENPDISYGCGSDDNDYGCGSSYGCGLSDNDYGCGSSRRYSRSGC
jgi:hypothetical protein